MNSPICLVGRLIRKIGVKCLEDKFSQGIYLLTWHSETFDHMNVFMWLHAEYSCAHMMSIHVLT